MCEVLNKDAIKFTILSFQQTKRYEVVSVTSLTCT